MPPHFGRMVALVRKKGATRQRGLELRLRDLSKLGTKSYSQTYDILKERAAHKKVNVRVHGKLTSLSGQLLALWQYITLPRPPPPTHPPNPQPFYYP